ncbi:MAG: HAD-IA family hydrolase [Alphaproteobacteria bacterium]|nr:HAD-IA family hydrolase [Alphaproteobacteria bacterium]
MSNAFPVRLAVFDCDGTLVDSQHSIVAAMHAAFVMNGLPAPAPESVRRVVGLNLSEAIRMLLPENDGDRIDDVETGYIGAYRAMRERGDIRDPLFPGASETIRGLEQEGWLLGIATGKSHRGLMATLDRHEMTDRFITLQTADRAAGKPHPEMLRNAMAETGAEGISTVMIGDTTFDIEMARNAGTLSIGVAWGYHAAQELADAGANRIISSFMELPAALRDLMQGIR